MNLTPIGYELAKNPEVQKVLQDEIDAAYEGSTNLDYNTVQSLPYLDMVINETLRLHPPLGVLERVCTKDSYKVSNLKLAVSGVEFARGHRSKYIKELLLCYVFYKT